MTEGFSGFVRSLQVNSEKSVDYTTVAFLKIFSTSFSYHRRYYSDPDSVVKWTTQAENNTKLSDYQIVLKGCAICNW
jgi:hypothetical protein